MGLELVTPPAVEPVSLIDIKTDLHIDGTDEDTLLQTMIAAARQRVEEHTGRALITQQWKYVLDMPNNKQKVPKPPLQTVDSIQTIDTDGTVNTVDSKDYIVDTSGLIGRVTPTKASRLAFVDPDLWRGIWPWHRGFASFIINFTAGYGDTADKVPYALRQAIMLYVGHLYLNREGQPTETKSALARGMGQTSIGNDLPPTVRDLLSPYVTMVM